MKKIASNKNYRNITKLASGIKVVFNAAYGGFGLSEEGEALYNHFAGEDEFNAYEVSRHDPILVHVVETLGDAAGGDRHTLHIKIIEGNQYKIDEYDGYESVITPESMRWITAEDQDFSFISKGSTQSSDAGRSFSLSEDEKERLSAKFKNKIAAYRNYKSIKATR